MSARSLQKLVTQAVISTQFRAGIMNGKRGELIRTFDLEPEEIAQVMAIRANTFEEFAAAINEMCSPETLVFLFRQTEGREKGANRRRELLMGRGAGSATPTNLSIYS